MKLRLLLEAYAGATLPLWQNFEANVAMETLAAGAPLYDQDSPSKDVFYVHTGLLKAQRRLANGRLNTSFFAEEGDVFACPAAFGGVGLHQLTERGLHPRAPSDWHDLEKASSYGVAAIEPSTLFRMDARTIDTLAHQRAEWAALRFNIAMMRSVVLQADVHWLREPPRQRYLSFRRRNPDLVDRLTQRDIASYLNITEEGLSRLMKRLRDEPEGEAEEVD